MGAIGSHTTPTSDGSWDGPAAKANLDNDGGAAYFKKAFAWQDPDANPDTKGAYKFINHEVSSDGTIGPANMTACSSGIGVLNGARGGSVIPDGDRKGVYNHLAKHLADGGKDAPDLKSYDEYLEQIALANGAKEVKHFTLAGFKNAGKSDDKQFGNFSGYASTWSKDSYGDVIAPGAFAQSIADNKGQYPIFFNHDPDNWIGFATNMAEDAKGLLMNGGLALGTSDGADVYALLQAADAIDFRVGLSIGFMASDIDFDGDTRILKTIDLWEVSVTPFPANKRAYINDVKALRNLERCLRDAGGFSATQSKRILASLNAARQPAPVRDVREARTLPAAHTSIRSQLWHQLQKT